MIECLYHFPYRVVDLLLGENDDRLKFFVFLLPQIFNQMHYVVVDPYNKKMILSEYVILHGFIGNILKTYVCLVSLDFLFFHRKIFDFQIFCDLIEENFDLLFTS